MFSDRLESVSSEMLAKTFELANRSLVDLRAEMKVADFPEAKFIFRDRSAVITNLMGRILDEQSRRNLLSTRRLKAVFGETTGEIK